MTPLQLSTSFLTSVYYSSLFNQCYICKIKKEGMLCHSCEQFLPQNTSHCSICARPSASHFIECGECQKQPPSFQHIITPFLYADLCRAMITKAKFNQKPHLLRPLVARLANSIPSSDWTNTRCYIVPTSLSSIKERGFCQTSLIRKWLLQNRLLNPHKKLKEGRLLRHKDRQAQHTLSRKERIRLSHQDFIALDCENQHAILIDDVITTGSTVEACAKALRSAGALSVTVWALARTPE